MTEQTPRVGSEAARLADRRRAREVYLYSAIAAGIFTLILYFL